MIEALFYAALFVIVMRSMRRRSLSSAAPARPVLSGGTMAGIVLALASLFVPHPPATPGDRRRSPTPPAVPAMPPQLAHGGVDGGVDASAAIPEPIQPEHGQLLANVPVYAADHTVAVDVDPAGE